MKTDIRRMIDGTKNAVFTGHPRPDNVSLLQQMLPVFGGEESTTAWFGGLDQNIDEPMQGPEEEEDDDDESKIAEIVGERKRGVGHQFLVRFKGNDEASDGWFPGREVYGSLAYDAWKASRD